MFRLLFMKVLFTLLCLGLSLQAQTIFPNLSGQELLDSLVASFKTTTVLPYSQARDTLFAKIDSRNDSLRGVYTGYTIYLDPTQDPTQYAFSNGINTEHTYPQSKGAVGQAKSDMHHLFPTRVDVNEARASNPFAEIPDSQTDFWYRLDYFLTTIPTQYIDEFSELDVDQGLFEPREDFKGNVARAMFYFYTMYRQEAQSADPQYFDLQKEVLYLWHRQDAVDSVETRRSGLIARYQGGKENPFILDSTLIRRAYFPNPVKINSETPAMSEGISLFQNFPNPFNQSTFIKYRLNESASVTLEIFDPRGKRVIGMFFPAQLAGEHTVKWDGKNEHGQPVGSGLYFIRLHTRRFVHTVKTVLLR